MLSLSLPSKAGQRCRCSAPSSPRARAATTSPSSSWMCCALLRTACRRCCSRTGAGTAWPRRSRLRLWSCTSCWRPPTQLQPCSRPSGALFDQCCLVLSAIKQARVSVWQKRSQLRLWSCTSCWRLLTQLPPCSRPSGGSSCLPGAPQLAACTVQSAPWPAHLQDCVLQVAARAAADLSSCTWAGTRARYL